MDKIGNGETPIMDCQGRNSLMSLDIVKFLVENGADVKNVRLTYIKNKDIKYYIKEVKDSIKSNKGK